MSVDQLPEPNLSAAAASDDHPPAVAGTPSLRDDPNREPVGILLVDDHHENLLALNAVLEPLGERLVSAESGEQALRVLLRQDIAVILLDVRMAGLDGVQTARIIRSRPRTRHIPIIFLTAQARDVSEISRAYASGAVDYVIKPFEPDILRAKVSVFVELSRERAERVRQTRARAEAEAVARTVRTLQSLSDAALAHLELDGLSAELLDRAGTLFDADAASLLLRAESSAGLRVHAHRGIPLPLPEDGRVDLAEDPLGQLAAERRAVLLRGEELRSVTPAAASAPAEERIASLLLVPIVGAGELLGMLLLGGIAEDRFDARDLELLTLAADRMAIAIDHAQRFAHGRELVETLQRSLLPERLPRHPRLALAARYLPSGLAPQVGGDWYDALELDRDRTAVMIGDVVGHGVRAATTMSELRNALRAFAIEGHRPGEALHQLDRLVQATLGTGMIATVLFLIVDVAEGTVTLARAGHPPPAMRAVDGTVRFLETENTLPLGISDRTLPSESAYPIAPGETLLLFTDGLVERRRESISVGLERLSEALCTAPADVEALCDHVLAQTIGVHPSDDDVALLAVRLLPQPTGPLKLLLPAQADSVPLARHRLRDWLELNVPVLDRVTRTDLEVAFSEACTNVVRHAYGPGDATFSASVTLGESAVALEIRDSGSWRPPRGEHGGRGLFLMQQLCDELLIDRRPDGTTIRMERQLSDGSPASDRIPS
jgi:serine phosphatase RsbU (regulator of sigma subunit)/CheY-like chemotaxis protein/anti-sigma regulatory factor (Ser/Thr protein kinase)